jgi:KUP system potassium uptake protein
MLLATSVAALGVVFGDIGTSPIYAFKECFAGHQAMDLSATNLVGAASLIVWSLILVVSVKYLFFILRLDNRGEGGILALAALIRSGSTKMKAKTSRRLLLFGLAGAALIYADGMLTPAISVLSAVEGLKVSAPMFAEWTVPVAIAILLMLFTIQQFGTGKVGMVFGPIVLLWFVTIAVLGVCCIFRHPQVLLSLSPHSGLMFLIHEWRFALPLLSAVFLAVTGGEALYADLGHFGIGPIRLAWFSLVLPALVLNYLGQAALLTVDPAAIENPFFLMAPKILQIPLTILATLAAIIASQALISGAFSLTTQAIHLGCLPRFLVKHTSEHASGQVYVPAVNWILAVACCALVAHFESSSNLAGAYGIAIALTMTITSVLFFTAAHNIWQWSVLKALIVVGLFMMIDGAFLVANSIKVFHGGLFPLVIGGGVMGLMLVWLWGRERLYARFSKDALSVDVLINDLAKGKIHRVSGTAIYMSGKGFQIPTSLLHNLKHNQILHERVLLLHVMTLDQPHACEDEMLEQLELGQGLYQVTMKFGFADTPDVPFVLKERLPEEMRFQPGNLLCWQVGHMV